MTFSLMKVLSRHSSQSVPTLHRGSSSETLHHTEHSHAEHHKKAHLPFIASPVDPEALKWLERRKRASSGLARSTTVAQFESEGRQTESGMAHRIFRKQHEASTLELFFDLFFVGNLAVFTTKSAHVDADSLMNYLGFFAILWTTWFHISMYDVRFYVDSIWTRFTKFLCFGAMTALTGLGPLYDAILQKDKNVTSRAFQGMAIMFFALRMLFVIQYAIVLWFVRKFDKTLIPLVLTMVVYVLSALAFLATWLQNRNIIDMSGAAGMSKVHVWYIIICVEALGVIVVSSIWRILSFKHTHLVERVGLLTLIIMGEGILGLTKSTSYTISGTNVILWQEVGIVGAAVLLIYMVYILYFDNIDHHRFGTIRQQVWTLLHFPLHVAILLTVEGQTALILWDAIRSGVAWIVEDSLPSYTNPAIIPPHSGGTGSTKFKDAKAFVACINSTYYEATQRYHYKKLSTYYNTTALATDLEKLGKPKAAFNTPDWVKEVQPTLKKMTSYYEYFLYQNFGAEGPKAIDDEKDYSKKVQYYEDGFKFVTIYFYIAAGTLLLVLAGLYVFGRTKMTKTEWTSFGIRVFGGMLLPLITIAIFTEKNDDAFRFVMSFILIPIVAVYYLLVICVDNIIKAISDRHHRKHDLRRSGSDFEDPDFEMGKKEMHGMPELVHVPEGDHLGLMQHAQKVPIVSTVPGGRYTELVNQDDDTEYRGGHQGITQHQNVHYS